MTTLILYGTSACHLCEMAEGLLMGLKARGTPIQLCKVDIADDDRLMERYGVRIPVIKLEGSEQDLGWPFGEEEVLSFLAQDGVA